MSQPNNRKIVMAGLAMLMAAGGLFGVHKTLQQPQRMNLMASGSIDSGQIVAGVIPSTSHVDSYTFYASTGDRIAISAGEVGTPTNFSPVIRLIRPNGTNAAGAQGVLRAFADYEANTSGTWTMEVTRTTGILGGSYEATMVIVPSFMTSISALLGGGDMYPGASYSGAVNRGDVDTYTFWGTGGSITLNLSLSSGTSGLRVWAQVYDEDGASEGAAFAAPSTPDTLVVNPSVNNELYTVLVYKGDQNNADGTYTLSVNSAGLPRAAKIDGEKCFNCCVGGAAVGDPINVASGNLFEEVTDYTTAGTNPLALVRSYNSLGYTRNTYPTIIGANWRTNYDRYLRIVSGSQATAERQDGQVINFTSSGTWTPDTDEDYTLTSAGSTYTLTDGNNTVETYTVSSGKGRLDTIAWRNGYSQSLSYTSTGNLSSVTDSYGRSFGFTFTSGTVNSVTTPDALTLSYAYTPLGSRRRLDSVTYNTSPTTTLTYHYEQAELPFMLTGITDENGDRFATWTYDGTSRVTSATHAGNAGMTSIQYFSNGDRLVTGPLGIEETYKFATSQNMPKVTQIDRAANGTVAAASRYFTYDANGYLASQTDWNGIQTAYTNNSYGDPTSIVYASGTGNQYTVSISYDGTWPRLPATITMPGVTSGFTYSSANGNMLTNTLTDTTSHTVPYSTNGQTRTWSYTYTSTGLLTQAQYPRTDLTTKTDYGYSGGRLSTITDGAGHVTTINTATGGGLPLTITDPNNNLTTLAYNNRNWLTSNALSVTGGTLTTSLQYDSAGNLTRETLPDASYLDYAYDDAHRLTSVTNAVTAKQELTLDDMGNVTQALWKDAGATTRRQQTATYDALGRVLTSVGGEGQTTAFTYDDNGNALTVTDPLTNVTTLTYDDLNRLSTVTDAATNLTSYTYDNLGRVLTVTDPRGKVTSYVYNGFGDVIQETSPDRGTWVWTYDKNANVTQQVDGTGATTNMTYDALDRILTRTYPADSSLNVAFTYDQTGHGDGIGRLTTLTDQAGSLSLDYDERALITSQARVIGGNTYTTGFTYESAGRLSTTTYPDAGWVVGYNRDSAGQISGVTVTEPGQSPVNVATSVSYMPFGPVAGFTYGNNVAHTRSYDLDYRVTSVRDQGSSTIYYTSNTWNANNNLTSIIDNVSATNNQSLTYDVIDRLTYASSGSYTSSSITYDSSSNRLTYGGTNYTIDSASNRMSVAGGSAITYISTGNISSIGTDTFTYNRANQMASGTVGGVTSTYAYDAFGQRQTSVVGGGTPVIQQYGLSGQLLSETQGSSETNYIYLNGLPLAAVNATSPAISYIHSNHLGTPQRATNAGQGIVWSGNYQPFGAVSPTTSITQNLRFPGQYADPTGLHYNMFRTYNPALGRYMESDPIGLAGGLNTYNYVLNNPYKWVDPSGLANPAELACTVGPNPVCILGVAADVATVGVIGLKMHSDKKRAQKIKEASKKPTGYYNSNQHNDAANDNTGSPEAAGVGATAGAGPTGIEGIPEGASGCTNQTDNGECIPPDSAVDDVEGSSTPPQGPEKDCYAECAHLLPSPSNDYQSSEFRKCYRECKGKLW